MPPRPPHPLARTVPVPAWAVLLALLGAAGGSLAALGVGYAMGRGGGVVGARATAPRSADDFPALRQRLMGASTSEVNAAIGPPGVSYVKDDGTVHWVYKASGPPAGTMFLEIRNDRVFNVSY